MDVFSRVLLEVFCPGGRIIGLQGVVGEGGCCRHPFPGPDTD